MSVVVHEVSHGFVAEHLGDPTARLAGRLTLNPLKHIDPVGSIFVPLILIVSKAPFVFGWAKPVPYNPHNLRNKRWGEAQVALAGPLSNILLALVFGLLIRFILVLGISLPISFFRITSTIVIVNLVLAFFNLVPVPPLDGSKILFAFLPARFIIWRRTLESYGFILVIFFVFFLWHFFSPLVTWVFSIITGLGF